MKTTRIPLCAVILLSVILAFQYSSGEVPGIINYQGRVAVNGTNFDGTGEFRFALVNTDASETYWSNDIPANKVELTVTKGLYSVLLGDTDITHMANAISSSVFTNTDVRLRVWFNDGVNGEQLLIPDQRLASAPYALQAASASGTYWDSVCGYVVSQSNNWDTSYTWVSENSNSFTLVEINTFIGDGAGSSNTTGQMNTYIGPYAGLVSTSGNYNTFVGYRAGVSNTSGSVNTYVGQDAGSLNEIGGYQTAVGAGALYKHHGNNTEQYNTAIGANAMQNKTNGTLNTAVGAGSFRNGGGGSGNVAVGRNAGCYCGGDKNIFVGCEAANNNGFGTITFTNGYYNIYIGYGANPSAEMVTNECVIGGANGPILDVYFGSGAAVQS